MRLSAATTPATGCWLCTSTSSCSRHGLSRVEDLKAPTAAARALLLLAPSAASCSPVPRRGQPRVPGGHAFRRLPGNRGDLAGVSEDLQVGWVFLLVRQGAVVLLGV